MARRGNNRLAAMINFRNEQAHGGLLTIDYPIKFMHQHKRSIVDHCDIGIDMTSCDGALKNALRKMPNVIMIGEILDRETMQQAMERVINFFPEKTHRQVLINPSSPLAGVIAQKLIPELSQELTPAVEVLLPSPCVSELIAQEDISGMEEAMGRSTEPNLRNADSGTELLRLARLSADINPAANGDHALEEALLPSDGASDLQK